MSFIVVESVKRSSQFSKVFFTGVLGNLFSSFRFWTIELMLAHNEVDLVLYNNYADFFFYFKASCFNDKKYRAKINVALSKYVIPVFKLHTRY